MGKLLITENGVQYWRNFKFYRVIWSDGRMSPEKEFAGTVILTTGTDERRTLEFVLPAHGVTKRLRRERLRDVAVTAAASLLLGAFLSAL